MTLDELCSHLLPPDEHLHFETLLFEDNHLTLRATMTAAKAVCPDCHQPLPQPLPTNGTGSAKLWQPQTPDTARRRKLAADAIAACDRRLGS